MSLTKAGLLEKAQGKFAWVEDVPVFGTIGVRSCPQLESSMRWVTYTDQETGKIIPEQRAKGPIHEMIDQLMEEAPGDEPCTMEQTETMSGDEDKVWRLRPMFTDADFDALAALDSDKLAHLLSAIRKFNGAIEKKELD